MKALWTALLVLSVCAAALAVPPKPFFGLNLNANVPAGDFAGKDIINQEGGAKTGWGGEIDLGLAWHNIDLYAGYMIAANPSEGESSLGYYPSDHARATGDWTMKRVVIGTRISATMTKIRPIFGVGITIGNSHFDPNFTMNGQSYQFQEGSGTSTAMFFEGGVSVPLHRNATFLALLQYHQYDANFETYLPEDMFGGGQVSSTFTISYIALRVGLAYRL